MTGCEKVTVTCSRWSFTVPGAGLRLMIVGGRVLTATALGTPRQKVRTNTQKVASGKKRELRGFMTLTLPQPRMAVNQNY